MAAFIDASGATQQIEANLDMVRAAKENGMSFRDYVNSTYTTDADRFGDAFSQMCASEGIVLQPNKQYGMKASSLDAVLNGRPLLEAGAIVRNPSNQGRVLLMPAIGALVEDKLVADLNMNADEFDRISHCTLLVRTSASAAIAASAVTISGFTSISSSSAA